MNETVHQPILLQEIVDFLIEPFVSAAEPGVYLDCTFGGGGHTAAMLERFKSDSRLQKHRCIGVDRDQDAIARGKRRFAEEISEGKLELIHNSFGEVADQIDGQPILGVLADLGFSSDQIEADDRGFSFLNDGPLDMRMDRNSGMSCSDYLAQASESDIETVLREWGEERFSRQIARGIVYAREEGRAPQTTKELVQIVVRSTPAHARRGRIHVATRTFQALRIEVNREIEQIDLLLNHVIMKTRSGGRVAIMSFHSLEDRRVKQFFKRREVETGFKVLTKKPVVPSDVEIKRNSRARSAKLRVVERMQED